MVSITETAQLQPMKRCGVHHPKSHPSSNPKTSFQILPIHTTGEKCAQSAHADPGRVASSSQIRGSPLQWAADPRRCTSKTHRHEQPSHPTLECGVPEPPVQHMLSHRRRGGHDDGGEWPATDPDAPPTEWQTRPRWSVRLVQIRREGSRSEHQGKAGWPTPIDERHAIK